MNSPIQQGHPNRMLYVGLDPVTNDAAAPYVDGGLMRIASYVYNGSTGQWQPQNPELAETQFSYINWVATANGTGYNNGDYLQQVDEYNISVTPAQYLGTTWRNVTQGTTLANPPTAGTYVPVSSIIQTVNVANWPAVQPVSATSWPLPTGASTSALQTTANSSLSTIATNTAGLGGPQTTVTTGQNAIASTGVAIQLGSTALINGVVVTADINNTGPIFVGNNAVTNTAGGAGNGYMLQPGASVSFAMTTMSPVYINGAAGDYVTFYGN